MITVVVGKEIEKIKGDFESYLNGLNMVGEISYSQYSELYDEGVKQIQRAYELGKSELEEENAELKEKINYLSEQIQELKIELDTPESVVLDKLDEAKEIIKDITSSYGSTEVSKAQLYLKIKRAEQFLGELE